MIPVSADAPLPDENRDERIPPDECDELDDAACTCDFDDPHTCPIHYPIDDGSEGDEEETDAP